jgi:hypothetical protein
MSLLTARSLFQTYGTLLDCENECEQNTVSLEECAHLTLVPVGGWGDGAVAAAAIVICDGVAVVGVLEAFREEDIPTTPQGAPFKHSHGSQKTQPHELYRSSNLNAPVHDVRVDCAVLGQLEQPLPEGLPVSFCTVRPAIFNEPNN